MSKKTVIITVFLVIALPVAWYLLSPLWRNIELDEASPILEQSVSDKPAATVNETSVVIKDTFDTMDEETMARFVEETDAMKDVVMEKSEPMEQEARLLRQGTFVPRAHDVAGRALLIEDSGKKILRFEDFETINGPKLNIYLASSVGDDDFVDLGPIRATKGNVNYEVDAAVDTDKYNKVLVWCVAFGVLFSYADLL
jgi:hypothetical protein